jgi:hypothetical protein
VQKYEEILNLMNYLSDSILSADYSSLSWK